MNRRSTSPTFDRLSEERRAALFRTAVRAGTPDAALRRAWPLPPCRDQAPPGLRCVHAFATSAVAEQALGAVLARLRAFAKTAATGAAPDVLRALVELAPRRPGHCACDPSAIRRDPVAAFIHGNHALVSGAISELVVPRRGRLRNLRVLAEAVAAERDTVEGVDAAECRALAGLLEERPGREWIGVSSPRIRYAPTCRCT